MNNGVRVLLIDYMLKRLTNDEHYLTRRDFINQLSDFGGHFSENTIKSDLECIKEFNALIDKHHKDILGSESLNSGAILFENVKKKGTHITQSVFTEGELIILYKFIENCFYLNNEEKKTLMQKIVLLVSKKTCDKLGLNDDFNESHYYNPHNKALVCINTIQKAIQLDLCLKFKYYTYDIRDNKFIETKISRNYLIYPIRFVMEGNYLYVIGFDIKNHEKHIKDLRMQIQLKTYRIDRMNCIQTTKKTKAVSDYILYSDIESAKNQVPNHINGFGGENYITLELKIFINNDIEKSPFKTFVDRFGNDIIHVHKYNDYIILTIDRVLNGIGLIHYLFGFDKQIEVLKPIELRESMYQTLQELCNLYQLK